MVAPGVEFLEQLADAAHGARLDPPCKGEQLIVAGLPFLGIRFTSVDAGVLPVSASARQVSDALHRDFATDASTPITVAVTAPASASDQVSTVAGAIRGLPGASEVSPPRLVGADTWVINVKPGEGWVDTFAVFHGETSTISFADGHAEGHRWLEGTTLDAARKSVRGIDSFYWSGGNSRNRDFVWVYQRYKHQKWAPL